MTTAGDIEGRNWVRSFEHGLSKILGINWWEVANLDRTSWKEGKHKFVCDAVRRWGGPKPLWRKAFVDNLACSSMLRSSEMRLCPSAFDCNSFADSPSHV